VQIKNIFIELEILLIYKYTVSEIKYLKYNIQDM